MTVHIKDMRTLPESVDKLFDEGQWVFSKTAEPFSFISLDQANEHSEKGSGGIVGLQQDKKLLQRWTIVSPELVRLIIEFEGGLYTHKNANNESETSQRNFALEVKEVVSAIARYGNHF